MVTLHISDVSEQIRGVSYKPSDVISSTAENAIGILRANNIFDGKINYDDLVYVKSSVVSTNQMLRKGDILICASSGSKNLVGKAAQIDADCPYAFGAFCKVIRPKNINSVFLGSYFQSDIYRNYISGVSQGVNINNIKNEHINSIEIRQYSEQEQRTIAYILEKAMQIVTARKQQLTALDTLVKARFVEMFGDPERNPLNWIVKPLSEVIVSANNGMARRGNDSEGNIVLRLVELQDGFIDYSEPNRILLNEKEQSRYLLINNDFLFARVNGNPLNVGRCAVFCDTGEPVYHNDHIIRVHFDESVFDGCFASELLNSNYGKRQMSNQIKTSAGQYTISQDGIGAIMTILPPMGMQKQFAAFVAQVDKSKVVVQKALDEAQLLFDSLMQQYFG